MATRHVDNVTGSDSNDGSINFPYLTFHKLITSLVAGEIGYIRGSPHIAGVYNDFFDGNTDSFPSGTSFSNAVTISAYPNETVIIQNNQSGNKSAIFTYINAPQYMIWQDLIIDGRYHEAHESGITLNYGSYIHFVSCTIYWSVLPVPPTIARQQGLFISAACDNIEITDCEVYNVPSHATYIGASNSTVQRCSFHHNGYWPGVLEVGDPDDPSEQHGNGVLFYGGGASQNNCTARDNRLYLNRNVPLLAAAGSAHSLINNLSWDNGAWNWGLKTTASLDCADVQASGSTSNVKIYHNSVAHTDPLCRDVAGIKIEATFNVSIVNNVVWGHDDLVDGFCFVDNNAGSSILLEDYNMSSDGTFPNASGHDVVNNPGWPDPANGDFSITISSPAYAACPRLLAVTTDFNGLSRPDPASMGALEPAGTVPPPGDGSYSELILGALPDNASHFIGPTVRNNALLDSFRSYYTVQLSRSGSTYILSLAKILNGVYVHITDTSAETFTSGDALALEATGSSTVTLDVKKNGSVVLTSTDTSLTPDSGFYGFAGGGAQDAPALSWSAGLIVAGVRVPVNSDTFAGAATTLSSTDGWTQQAASDGLIYKVGDGTAAGGAYVSVDAVVYWTGIVVSSEEIVMLGIGGGG